MDSTKNLMTEGLISKKIMLFAMPIFLGNLFQQLYNIIDSLVVGNANGTDALAAVSSSGSLIFLLVGLFGGIFVGAGVVISRYYGAQDLKKVELAIHTTIAFGLICGVILTIIGVTFSPSILRLMGTPKSVLPNSILYFRIYFGGILSVVLYNTASGIFQALGDSRHPLYYLFISSVINILLDLLFVMVFRWGIAGAGIATLIAQTTSAVLAFYHLFHNKEEYHIDIRKIRLHGPMLKQILIIGIPSGLQNSIIAFANLVVQSNINSFDAMAIAGCGAYSKIEGFAFLPITSFSLALTTFISQNLGANKYDRAKKGARFGILTCVALAELVGLLIYVFAPVFIKFFDSNETVIAFGSLQAHTCTLFYFLLAYSHCLAGIFRGAGKSIVPMIVMLICWCMIRVSYVTILIHYIPKIQVIFWAYPLTWFLSSVIFTIYYFKADWIHGYEL